MAVPNLGNEAMHEYRTDDGAYVTPRFILDEATSFFKNVLQAKSVSAATPLKEHGVYTVFVDLGNTKIEVSRLHLHGATLGNMNDLLASTSTRREKSDQGFP